MQIDGSYIADPKQVHGPKYGPYYMTVEDSDGGAVSVKDVTFGDVYVCAGDTEMAELVQSLPAVEVTALLAEAASNFSSIRLFNGGGSSSRTWARASDSAALKMFSGLCYTAGRAMQVSDKHIGAACDSVLVCRNCTTRLALHPRNLLTWYVLLAW